MHSPAQLTTNEHTLDPLPSEAEALGTAPDPQPFAATVTPLLGGLSSYPPGSNVSDSPDKHRKPRGKIGRLSRELRDLVNNLLADGATAAEVVQKLGEHGVSLTTNNVYDWYHGHHQLWLAEQQLLEESRLRHELTLDFAREAPGTGTFQGAQKLAAALIAEAVARFGPDTLRVALQSDPMNLFRALHALARLTDGDVKCERLVAEAAERELKLKLQKNSQLKRASAKTLDEVKRELNLL